MKVFVTVAMVGLGWLAGVGDAPAQTRPEYAIKEDAPRVGSMIRRNMVSSPGVAINLPYEQLSAEEQQRFKASYERLAEGDEPPFPRQGLKALYDPVLKAQSRFAAGGDLFVVALVGADGKVTEVRTYGSPSVEMTRFASELLLITSFKPAVCGGRACAMEFPLRMALQEADRNSRPVAR